MINILIDNRETLLKDYFTKYNETQQKTKYNFTFCNLDLGDIIIKKDENIILIIERKTIKDLFSSIRDGRYKEQKLRLINNFCKNQILYLVEDPIKINNDKYYKNYKSIVSGALVNTIYRDKINVLRSFSIEETIDFILLFCKKIENNLEFFLNNNTNETENENSIKSYENTIKIKKKDNMTPKTCYIIQLSQIPGVSNNIANLIYEKYNSFSILINEYNKLNNNDEKEKMLENLTFIVKNDKKRKIGPVLSKRIYNFLFSV